ncbi:MAG: dihydroxyacetone kinase subunit L [Acidimicrobiia bacterium]|nr:dihydroxyacetone kinase subunit L [Acidimicrobiia bacterium]
MTVGVEEVVTWIGTSADRITERRDELTKLDSAIGDADHGANMTRGFKAVVEKLNDSPPETIAEAFKTTAMTLISKVGGASGPLYGTMFLKMSQAADGMDQIGTAEWADLLDAALDGIVSRGKAVLEDKTMVDALSPAVDAVRNAADSRDDLETAMRAMSEAAAQGVAATIPLVARKGRASYLGERSAGHQDPGATSTHLILDAAADTLK